MRTARKIIGLVLAGALAACLALGLGGCFGFGSFGQSGSGSGSGTSDGSGGAGSGSGGGAGSALPDYRGGDKGSGAEGSGSGSGSGGASGSSGSSGQAGTSPVGTWIMSEAVDFFGNAYDVEEVGPENVMLMVTDGSTATFLYFDDEPFKGQLVRDSSGDDYYSDAKHRGQCYHLTDADGAYWELAFITALDGSDAFWYLEVGPEDEYDSIYLDRTDASVPGAGSATGGFPSGSADDSRGLVGTWVLDYAHDFDGDPYDISDLGDAVKLVISSETTATFHYFDDEPFKGELMRAPEGDEYYANDGYTVECYQLKGGDGSYWEFAYVVPDDGSEPFFYLEVGGNDDYDSLYLSKVEGLGGNAGSGNEGGIGGADEGDGSRIRGILRSDLTGTWSLTYAEDHTGKPYDPYGLDSLVYLVVDDDGRATFFYFDDEPYEGTLTRESSLDGTYPGEGCSSMGYRLKGSDDSYWEFLFVLPNDVSQDSFWYLEVGSSQPDVLVLSRVVQ